MVSSPRDLTAVFGSRFFGPGGKVTTAQAKRAIGVLGMGTYLPAHCRSNEEVAARSGGVTAPWIARRTGVLSRHVAAPHEAASDLAAVAVRRALSAAGLEADQVDLIVLGSGTPDEIGSATACRVQALTGASRAVALDVTAACAGWVFGARVARDWLLADSSARYAVVVGVEVFSRFLSPCDRSTLVLFGDGAAAAVLGPVPADGGFRDFRLGSDGAGADLVRIPAGGSRDPASISTVESGGHTVQMRGQHITSYVSSAFPRVVSEVLARNNLGVKDIDVYANHQPNPVLLTNLAEQAGIPMDRLVIVGDTVGNIGAASAPYALAAAAARDQLKPGSRVLITAYGAGLTWAGALLTWTGAPVCHQESGGWEESDGADTSVILS
ncbi:3-oxoacyl-ACP synthase III family protein [Streptomyces sp. NPDC059680]|uniref:3-oxoacyl-ACP synthase III family protein n=1 Tax=Streptomyces sp. NPDC059680 TaxID=3346904 RepID=UPI0036C92217